ncbi:hypothetical protein P7C70_g8164, partial [Phenoliferia sp. Uapishka_3]
MHEVLAARCRARAGLPTPLVSAHILSRDLDGDRCVFCGGVCAVEVVESSHQARDHKLFSTCEYSKDHLLNPRYPALATKEDKPSSNAPLICRACPVGASFRTITRYGAEAHWNKFHNGQARDLAKEVLVPQAKRSGKLIQLFVAVSSEERNTVLEVEKMRCIRAVKVARKEQMQSDTHSDSDEPEYNPAPTRSGRIAPPNASTRPLVSLNRSTQPPVPTANGAPPSKPGRGRPRKHTNPPPPILDAPPQPSASASTPVSSASNTSHRSIEHNHAPGPAKRPIGRPPKRPLDVSALSLRDVTNRTSSSSAHPTGGTAPPPPPKRPRGRPRKVVVAPPSESESSSDDEVEAERERENLPRLRSSDVDVNGSSS